jgi:hypothetical protein
VSSLLINSLKAGCTLLLFGFLSCNNTESSSGTTADSTPPTIERRIINDTVPQTRTVINKKPVASFSKKVPDELNDWKFAVNIYETKATFVYLIKMQYMELTATDTLKIPNFGMAPVVQIKPGTEQLSCIIGFLNKKSEFLEYKLVTAKDDKLKVKVLHGYAVTAHKE